MRVIHYSNSDGSKEGVFFTEDFEMDARDAIPPNCVLCNDFAINDKFPSSFPMEYNLEKTY